MLFNVHDDEDDVLCFSATLKHHIYAILRQLKTFEQMIFLWHYLYLFCKQERFLYK